MKKLQTLLFTLFVLATADSTAQCFIYTDKQQYYSDIKEQTDEYIQIEIDDRFVKIPLDEIKLIEEEESGVRFLNLDLLHPVDKESITGYVLKPGNNVYIPYSSTKIVTRVGSRELRRIFQEDKTWNVVGCEEEAHFVVSYTFDRDSDKAFFIVRDRDGNELYRSDKVKASDFIPHHAGEESAERLWKKELPKFKNYVNSNNTK